MRQLILTLLLFSSSFLMAQKPFIQDVWLNENRTTVKANAMVVDQDGYMIIGTDQGLFRYNGSTFRPLKRLGNAPVTALSLQQGKVWVGFKNGTFGYVLNDSVLLVRPAQYKLTTAIHAITLRPDASIWLGTEDGIVQIQGTSLHRYNSSNGLSDDFIYTLDFIRDNRIVCGTDQGINVIDIAGGKAQVKTFSSGQGLQDNIARVVKNTGDPSLFLIGAQQGGLSFYDAARNRCYPLKIAGGWIWGQVNDLVMVSASRAYVATDDGFLVELVMNTADSATATACSFSGRRIHALLADKAGNIWCATDNGISLITSEFLNYIAIPPPFSITQVTAMTCSRDQLWFALKQDVYVMDLRHPEKAPRKIFHAAEPVSVLYYDQEEVLWLGTSGDGLWLSEEAGTRTFRKIQEPSLAGENILSLTVVSGQLWLSGLNGVKQFNRTGSDIDLVKTHNKASGIGSDYIYQLFGDSRGRVWMATDGAGVCMYDKGQYYHWSTFGAPNSPVVYTLTEDAGKSIWAGTLYKDLLRFKSGQWTNVRKKEVQDIDVNLSAINANATGQVVAVYQRCIDLWYPESRFFRHFNNRHNMGMDSTSRVLNCSARDREGNVYVPFEKGLLVFKNQRSGYDISPDIHITRISNNLKDRAVQDHNYAPDENYMSFYFEGISFTNPERLNYRFRLEGYSENWVYTNELSATFPKLPPGNFTFRVQVSLNGSFDHAKEAVYVFTIDAPLWKRPWFIIVAVLWLLGLSYLVIRYRDRKLQRLALLEQEKVMFDYEHLKSQVNPHFLFNSLNTLTSLIEDNPEDAVAYTERLSDLYRNMLTYHNKDLITLGEEWNILSAYLYIQQSRFGMALQIHGNIPEPLKASKKIPPMALQLLVENAIKHNVVSLSSPLVIEVRVDDKEITVLNKIQPKIRKDMESGIGLANISNRYTMLTRRKVHFGKEGENWVVKLPLL